MTKQGAHSPLILVCIGAGLAAALQFWPIEPGGTGKARGLLELLNLFVTSFGKVGAGLTVSTFFLVLAINAWSKGSTNKSRYSSTNLNSLAALVAEEGGYPASRDQVPQSGKAETAAGAPKAMVSLDTKPVGSFGRKMTSLGADRSGPDERIHMKKSRNDEPVVDREVASVLDRFGEGSPETNAIAIRAAIRVHDGITGILYHAIKGIEDVQQQIVLQSARLLLSAWANQAFSFELTNKIELQLKHFDSLLSRFDESYADWISSANEGYNDYHVMHISRKMESARKVAELVRWAAGGVPKDTTPWRRFYGFFDNIRSMDQHQWPDVQRDAIERDMGKLSLGRHSGMSVVELMRAPLWHSQDAHGYDAHRLASRFAVAAGIGPKNGLPYSYCDWLSERRIGKTLKGGPYENEKERYRRIVDLDYDWGDAIPAETVHRSIGDLLTARLDSKFWKRAYPALREEPTA